MGLPPQVHHLLRNFLKICRHETISKFLFSPTPDQLSRLSRPDLPHTAFYCENTITRVQPPTLHPNPNNPTFTTNDSHSHSFRLLVVPFHSIPPFTLGIGVVQNLINLTPPFVPSPLSDSKPVMLTFRCVVDSNTQTLLCVVDIPERDVIFLYQVQYSSSTHCSGFMAPVVRSSFLRAVSANPSSVRLSELLASFKFIINDNLDRPCLVCNAPSTSNCGCSLSSLPPCHFGRAMHQMHGNFRGVSSKFYNPLAAVSLPATPHIALGISHDYKQTIPIRLMQPLRWWAFLKSTPFDPRDSVQFGYYGDYTLDEHADGLRHDSSLAIDWREAENLEPDSRRVLSELLAVLSVPATERAEVDAQRREGLVLSAIHDEGAVEAVEVVEENWLERRECEPPPRAATCMRNVAPTAVRAEWVDDAPKESDVEALGESARGELELPTNEKETEPDVETIIRRMKAEERKRRNRASAHRSNARKRAVKEALNKELCQERGRLCELRLKLKHLQEENARLRASLEGAAACSASSR